MGFSKEKTLAVKGFAVIAMLFHHCFFSAKIYAGYAVDFMPLSEETVNYIALFFKLCVGSFAFLSGYGLSVKWREKRETDHGLSRYLVSRYINTMSGYWFVFIVCCVVYQLLDGRTVSTYFSGKPLENLAGLTASFLGLSRLTGTPMLIYEWWYMSAAVVFILMVPLFYESVRRAGAIAVAAALVLLPRTFGVTFQGGTQPFSFLMPVLLGVIFEQKQLFDVIQKKVFLRFSGFPGILFRTCFGIAGFLLAYWLYRQLPFEAYWEIKYGLVPALVILCLNEAVFCYSWPMKAMAFFGKHSTNMYLLHMLFLTYTKGFLFHERHFLFSWGVLVLITAGCSVVFELVKGLIRWSALIRRLSCAVDGALCKSGPV